MLKKIGYTFLAVFIAATGHELGHAIAFKAEGVEIETIGFGLPLPFLPTLNLNPSHFLGKTKIVINLLPVLAYVKPGKGYQEEPWPTHSAVNAAGITVNLILAAPLVIILLSRLKRRIKIFYLSSFLLGLFLLFILPSFIFPLVIIGLTTMMIVKQWWKDLVGPVGVFKLGFNENKNFKEFLNFFSLISLGLAAGNSLPIFPLDGGNEVYAILLRLNRTVAFNYEVLCATTVLLVAITYSFRLIRPKRKKAD